MLLRHIVLRHPDSCPLLLSCRHNLLNVNNTRVLVMLFSPLSGARVRYVIRQFASNVGHNEKIVAEHS